MTVLVFGHRNPDTDAICSAITYADLLQKTTRPTAIAACCGTPNKRTEFVLRRCKLSAPRIVMDVRPEAEDVCQRNVISARKGDVFYQVYQRMKEFDLRAIPVIDDDRKVIGILSLLDLMELIFQGEQDSIRSRTVNSSLSKICEVLGGSFQHSVNPDESNELLVMVGAMSADGFTSRMHKFPSERVLVVSGDRPTIHLPAIENGVRGIVITGGYELSPGLVSLAKLKNVSIIRSPFDTATTTMRIKSSQFIDSAVDVEFIGISARQPVADARADGRSIARTNFSRARRRTAIGRSAFQVRPPEPSEAAPCPGRPQRTQSSGRSAEEAEILEVLDHHRLGGGLKSAQPIRFINEPVGSTCTLVARQYRASGIQPTSSMALCMASGIISDTLFLRSPTTTDIDRDTLNWLRSMCECDLEEYAQEFFEIGSALRTCTPDEVIREDCKEFSEHEVRFSISQIEENGFDLFWNRKDELLAALKRLTETRMLNFSSLLVTDIVTNGSLLLLSHDSDAWDDINYPRLDRNLYELANIVSRKKQLLPLIAQLLETARESNGAAVRG